MLIKKRRYWPKHIKGDVIKEHFADKHVGTVDAWQGRLDDVPFYVFAMKELDYVMNLMSTYGTYNRIDDTTTLRHYKDNNDKDVSTPFKYTEIVNNQFQYRHLLTIVITECNQYH